MRSTILTIFSQPSGRQAEILPALPAASSSQGTEPPQTASVGVATTLPSIESVILQKLLGEIETRQLARAQPTYVIQQAPPARHSTTLVRTLCALLWASSMIACVFVVKYIDSQTMVSKDDPQSRSIENLRATIGDQNKEFSTMIDSLQGLANVIASSSRRTEAIPEMITRLGSDLQQIRSPLIRQPVEIPPEPTAATIITVPPVADSAPIPMGGHHHPPMESSVAPMDAVVHHNSLGVMDYWLLPRTVSGVLTMAKVVPIWQSKEGTLVHHVEEAKDYLVTPSGEWVAAPEANGSK